MKKIMVELIVPDDIDLGIVSCVIQEGFKNFVVSSYTVVVGDVDVKLKPDLVTSTPFNPNRLTMVLSEFKIVRETGEILV